MPEVAQGNTNDKYGIMYRFNQLNKMAHGLPTTLTGI
jgi:hypothetical protein